jgi:chemotaxis protein MotB
VAEVAGRADEELLVPDNPTSPRNRRISILLKYRTEAPGGGGQRARENVNGAAGTATGDTTITATPSPDGDNGAAQQQTGPSILDEQ